MQANMQKNTNERQLCQKVGFFFAVPHIINTIIIDTINNNIIIDINVIPIKKTVMASSISSTSNQA